MAQSN